MDTIHSKDTPCFICICKPICLMKMKRRSFIFDDSFKNPYISFTQLLYVYDSYFVENCKLFKEYGKKLLAEYGIDFSIAKFCLSENKSIELYKRI